MMEEWRKIRKRYFLLEVAGIALILSCFLMGIWSDWNVLVRKNALIIIENIESFSLTILQMCFGKPYTKINANVF